MQRRERGRESEREREREGGGTNGWMASPLSLFQHPNTLPGEACQCLYCYLICKNGKIVCSSKEAYKYRREKNRREKFVLGEILTAPKRKISIKWSCRTTSIIHTHSGGQVRTLTLLEGKREERYAKVFSYIASYSKVDLNPSSTLIP